MRLDEQSEKMAPSAERTRLLLALAYAHLELGRAELALATAEEGVAEAISLHGESHLETALALGHLGRMQERLGRFLAAEHSYEKAVEAARSAVGGGHPAAWEAAGLLDRVRRRHAEAREETEQHASPELP